MTRFWQWTVYCCTNVFYSEDYVPDVSLVKQMFALSCPRIVLSAESTL